MASKAISQFRYLSIKEGSLSAIIEPALTKEVVGVDCWGGESVGEVDSASTPCAGDKAPDMKLELAETMLNRPAFWDTERREPLSPSPNDIETS
jgi:hypothetical protein